ncbi:hypothetical protein EDB89DRAFT_2016159 [Lactarius sanguifluus]|nr:hypothetical protein EDB89DRAFT_2016159 [Lactarius sanguifluus]
MSFFVFYLFGLVSFLPVSLHFSLSCRTSSPRRLATRKSIAAASTLRHRHPITACKTRHDAPVVQPHQHLQEVLAALRCSSSCCCCFTA